jgi:hypothetical protein
MDLYLRSILFPGSKLALGLVDAEMYLREKFAWHECSLGFRASVGRG